ncbi:MAG: laccase, partial [Pseudomonadota bacterium]
MFSRIKSGISEKIVDAFGGELRRRRLATLPASALAGLRPLLTVSGLSLGSLSALAGPGFVDINGVLSPTYYANSPAGMNRAGSNSGTALRKFVDGLPGVGAAGANNLGNYIPVAVAEKWVTPDGVTTSDDYYEIGIVEFEQRLHSDLAKPTRLRGYIQLVPLNHAVPPGAHALTYPDGSPIHHRDASGQYVLDGAGNRVQVMAYDKPHALGPLIPVESGVAVRLKVTNLLPVGRAEVDAQGRVLRRNGDLFLPVDKTIIGSGVGPDGVTWYTENRASVHLHGGDSPWISDGKPHQWIAPAGEADLTAPTSV